MNKSDNRICGSHPKYFVTKSSKVSIFLRSDSDPQRGAIKNFMLRLEKTRGKISEFENFNGQDKFVKRPYKSVESKLFFFFLKNNKKFRISNEILPRSVGR